MKEDQIFRKEIQGQEEAIPNPAEGNPNKILAFSSPNRTLSRSYADPHGVFLVLRRFRPQTRRDRAGCLVRSGSFSCSFCLRFCSSGLMRQEKGWRHFDRECLDAVSADLAAASLCAKKGILGPRARRLGTRQGDRSDVRQEYVRLKRARSGLEPSASGRAPALHA
jgi:hypothetical protein